MEDGFSPEGEGEVASATSPDAAAPGIIAFKVCTACMMGSRNSQPAATREPPRQSRARPIMNTFEARLGLFKGREREALAPEADGKERPALLS